MSNTNIEERVQELEERVAYLERELELSVDEQRFEEQIRRLPLHNDEYEIEQSSMGNYMAKVQVHGNELQRFIERVGEMDEVGWSVEDADDSIISFRVEEGLINR